MSDCFESVELRTLRTRRTASRVGSVWPLSVRLGPLTMLAGFAYACSHASSGPSPQLPTSPTIQLCAARHIFEPVREERCQKPPYGCDCVHDRNSCACDACLQLIWHMQQVIASETYVVMFYQMCALDVVGEIMENPSVPARNLDLAIRSNIRYFRGRDTTLLPTTAEECLGLIRLSSRPTLRTETTQIMAQTSLWCPDIARALGISPEDLAHAIPR